ncbi:MAG: hypothetical protein ACOX78_07070 [Lachnospiraceae bacterium]|jgi:hypothetical protein
MTDIEHQSEKEKLSQLHGKAKVEYIFTYYKIYFVFALIAVFAIWIIADCVENAKHDLKFGMAVLNASDYDLQDSDTWDDKLHEELGYGEYEDAVVNVMSYPTDSNHLTEESMASQEKLVTLIAAQEIDMILAPEETCEALTENVDYFYDLSEYLPDDIYDKLVEEDRIVTLTTQDGETIPALIRLTEDEVNSQFTLSMEDPVIGIVSNSQHTEDTCRVLRMFLGMEEPETESTAAEETTTSAQE